ncbi:hypothetical protein BCEN4_430043 [Burkholderia cenocepacia]|nr:hypothetical protein BCEN4_430043 [Burkholderia cenocepacia]
MLARKGSTINATSVRSRTLDTVVAAFHRRISLQFSELNRRAAALGPPRLLWRASRASQSNRGGEVA